MSDAFILYKNYLNPLYEYEAMLTEHGRLKAYHHRFKIIKDPACTGGEGNVRIRTNIGERHIRLAVEGTAGPRIVAVVILLI